jgi:hypothetical protein
MGKDKETSNDNGKGADIFNNVKGMIDKIIVELDKYDESLKKDPEVLQYKIDTTGYENVKLKIKYLKECATKFDNGREDKQWRTADGGTGDPDNANKFSGFQTSILDGIKQIFKYASVSDIAQMGRENRRDLDLITKQIADIDSVKKNTIDTMAKNHRTDQLRKETGQKRSKEFATWYDNMEENLKATFEALLDAVNESFDVKKGIYISLFQIRKKEEKEAKMKK